MILKKPYVFLPEKSFWDSERLYQHIQHPHSHTHIIHNIYSTNDSHFDHDQIRTHVENHTWSHFHRALCVCVSRNTCTLRYAGFFEILGRVRGDRETGFLDFLSRWTKCLLFAIKSTCSVQFARRPFTHWKGVRSSAFVSRRCSMNGEASAIQVCYSIPFLTLPNQQPYQRAFTKNAKTLKVLERYRNNNISRIFKSNGLQEERIVCCCLTIV